MPMVKPGPYLTSILTNCVFLHMRCLRQICGISLLDHITNLSSGSGVKPSLLTLSLKAKGLGGLVRQDVRQQIAQSTHAWTV